MSKETLNSKTAYQLLIKDIITTEADFKEDKNRWILHCIYSGIAAGRIADKLGLDSDYAKALGYIHDIGRRISHPKHPIEGFNYMKELGYEEEGSICLTHSFIDNDITLAAGPFPPQKAYDFMKPHLLAKECNIYDNIIQLCDLFCLETGFTTIEKRILDISLRKGVYPSSKRHFIKTIELKERLEKKLGCGLYDLFGEIPKDDLKNADKCHKELLELFSSIDFSPLNIGLDITKIFSTSLGNNKSKYTIDKLLRDGHKIYMLYFGEASESSLKDWLDKNNINYTKVICTSDTEKVKTFIEEEIDITFTNNEGFHNELNKNAILSMHLSNEYSSEESPPFTKIRNWEEISKVIAILSTTSKNDEKYRKMIKNNIKST